MCPLWPLHVVIIYFLMLAPLWIVAWGTAVHTMKIASLKFKPSSVEIQMGQTKQIHVYSENPDVQKLNWMPETEKDYVAKVNKTYLVNMSNNKTWTSMFDIEANFLGKTNVKLRACVRDKICYESTNSVDVTVTREEKLIDRLFTYSIVVLISTLYINFGCALNWQFVREILMKPVGPVIGFGCQFMCMPMIGYGLAKYFFPGMPEMQLGLFFTGLSPGGGASNIWCVALNANVDLSIAMTTVSSVVAFGMIPFWLFTVGHVIFSEAKLAVPYAHILHYVICLVLPLAIGYFIQKFLPKMSRVLVRLLKPLSVALIVFIIVFASIINAYIFQLFTWRILAAGLTLPTIGYIIGFLTAWILDQPFENVIAIAIETGVQNTGIAIFMLRLSLAQPAADITTVIPVAVSLMTPVPLLIFYASTKLQERYIEWRKNRELKERIIADEMQV